MSPESESSSPTADERPLLATHDDAEIARLAAGGDERAKVELAARLRFEHAWSGEWTACAPVRKPAAATKPRAEQPYRRSRPDNLPPAPLPACPVIDGRLFRPEFIPHNPKERFQANIARFSKFSDAELLKIAAGRTSPETKAARHILDWRSKQRTE